ncbi:carbon-nitrogen hydrolase family protein [Paracandidimonas soli]|uniref:Nitrilase n=1 Tax=Paracandidimonas soli TaxID=1917182 RepID=A0A4R3V2Z9_9BURK|nr:carbon-nitrogen hydrolase family protein [Paracandidimonas soli]TCU99186.1 nitrilase [Paracandidimonas soli]
MQTKPVSTNEVNQNGGNPYKVAAIQMVSSTRPEDNLARAGKLIAEAAAAGARLIALPEYFCLMGSHDHDKVGIREPHGGGVIQDFLRDQAKRHGIWLVGGTLPLESGEQDRIYNTSLVFDPEGREVARYDKIHLFGFSRGDESYDESVSIRPGDIAPRTFDSDMGKVGLAICYDLRFPELFRAFGDVSLIVLPAAFTYTTGSAHWELLLRARAVENQCYVLASAQGGRHENGRRTWGHSMLIDPWGNVVDRVEEGEGFAIGTIDKARLSATRESLPALKHRRL